MEIEADRAVHLRFKPQAHSQNPLKRVELPNTSTGKPAPECLKEFAGMAIPSQVTLELARTLPLQKRLKRLLKEDLDLEPKPL
jgi:hypothetical protein